jgi:MoxR-like ATPase
MSNLPPLPPVPSSGEKTVAQIEQLPAIMAQLQKSVEQVVVGQNATVEAILVALITRGHC